MIQLGGSLTYEVSPNLTKGSLADLFTKESIKQKLIHPKKT